ncbi:hypothetical protein BDP27DRAFT_1428459 [Rhodocollybia butyracea]|uniref:Metaxin glutathione S-transferase domain-containing protein n=1 Tax=Rhodocollybia butyracea TaxID=206335 RepID=A0A9P5PDJ9_9AGAR|nr:hypothetical protein BDP27DRAFT_1428459 [Rhodocollybia butyracea]
MTADGVFVQTVVADLIFATHIIKPTGPNDYSGYGKKRKIKIVCSSFAIVVSDTVLLYRLYILCNSRLRIVAFPLLVFVFQCGIGIWSLISVSQQNNVDPWNDNTQKLVLASDIFGFVSGGLNVMCTKWSKGLIVACMWRSHRRLLAAGVNLQSPSTYTRVGAIIINSAIINVVCWLSIFVASIVSPAVFQVFDALYVCVTALIFSAIIVSASRPPSKWESFAPVSFPPEAFPQDSMPSTDLSANDLLEADVQPAESSPLDRSNNGVPSKETSETHAEGENSLRFYFTDSGLQDYTYPSLHPNAKTVEEPTIWVHPPSSSLLSSDVECQAYLALRGLDGAVGGRFPNLHPPPDASPTCSWTANNTGPVLLLSAQIVEWVDGYKDEAAKDESRAWVALLEEHVHAALIVSKPSRSLLQSLFGPPTPPSTAQSLLVPPPTSGFFPLYSITFFSPFGAASNKANIRISPAMKKATFGNYADAVEPLSENLGSQKWLLGSEHNTPLDALLFAYLHCLLQSYDVVRAQVTARVNLVASELRVRRTVKVAFVS